MALVIAESFDSYASGSESVTAGLWDASTSSIPIVNTPTRWGFGNSFSCYSGGYYDKVFTNSDTIYINVAIYQTATITGTTNAGLLELWNASNALCNIQFRQGGTMVLRSGNGTTVLATYNGSHTQNTWTHLQIKIVIHNTAGSITVRKDGATTDTWSATGLNTRAAGTDNFANVFRLLGNQSVSYFYMDDLLVFTGSGGAPNNWVGETRTERLRPMADTAQKNFTTSIVNGLYGYTSAASSTTYSGGRQHFYGFADGVAGANTGRHGGTATAMQLKLAVNFTGSMRAGIYTHNADIGRPAALLAATNEVVNPTAGTVTFTFPSPVTLQSNTTYWMSLLFSATATLNYNSTSGGYYYQSRTYASGLLDPPSTQPSDYTSATYAASLSVVMTPNNYDMVSDYVPDYDADYITSTTPNHEDQYEMENLSSSPASIILVQTRMVAAKADAGEKKVAMTFQSGETKHTGSDILLTGGYVHYVRNDIVDPTTGASWTTNGVNSVKTGVKVVS